MSKGLARFQCYEDLDFARTNVSCNDGPKWGDTPQITQEYDVRGKLTVAADAEVIRPAENISAPARVSLNFTMASNF